MEPKSPTPDPRASERLAAIYERGLERCRHGELEEGLVDLAWLAENRPGAALPALCYSYLGYGLARYRGQVDRGLRLCKHAIKLEFYQPESYVNLARTALLADRRREAAAAVRKGLKVDGEHPELLELRRSLGFRRRPMLPFFSRDNIFNRILGWLRHQFSKG